MRPDGTRVKDLPPLVAAIPYIMPKRYDAWNSVTENIDVVWLAYHLDKHGLLPRKIIDLSPFHTSMFITNLASIKTSYIHHHCYEFGTTSVFVCMGKPVPNYISGDLTKKMMPIGVVMDERICTGYEYAAFCNDFRRYMRLPRMLEYPFCQEEPAKEPSQETAAV